MSESKQKKRSDSPSASNLCKTHGGGLHEKGLLQRYVSSKLSRDELEDRFYTAREKNIELKKIVNDQEEKIKLLGTKLLRLTNQQKKEGNSLAQISHLEELLDSQANRIAKLHKTNKKLLEKINNLRRDSDPKKSYLLSEGQTLTKRASGQSDDRHSSIIRRKSSDDSKNRVMILEKKLSDLKHNYSSQVQNLEKSLNEHRTLLAELQEQNEQIIHSKDSITLVQLEDMSASAKDVHNKDKKFKDASVQTETDSEFEMALKSNKRLSQQLAEESAKVLELQHEISILKIAHTVVKDVEHHLFKPSDTMVSDKVTKGDLKTTPDKTYKLKSDLIMEKQSSEALKNINKQLISKLLSLQKDMDKLQISVRANKFTSVSKSPVRSASPPHLVPKRHLSPPRPPSPVGRISPPSPPPVRNVSPPSTPPLRRVNPSRPPIKSPNQPSTPLASSSANPPPAVQTPITSSLLDNPSEPIPKPNSITPEAVPEKSFVKSSTGLSVINESFENIIPDSIHNVSLAKLSNESFKEIINECIDKMDISISTNNLDNKYELVLKNSLMESDEDMMQISKIIPLSEDAPQEVAEIRSIESDSSSQTLNNVYTTERLTAPSISRIETIDNRSMESVKHISTFTVAPLPSAILEPILNETSNKSSQDDNKKSSSRFQPETLESIIHASSNDFETKDNINSSPMSMHKKSRESLKRISKSIVSIIDSLNPLSSKQSKPKKKRRRKSKSSSEVSINSSSSNTITVPQQESKQSTKSEDSDIIMSTPTESQLINQSSSQFQKQTSSVYTAPKDDGLSPKIIESHIAQDQPSTNSSKKDITVATEIDVSLKSTQSTTVQDEPPKDLSVNVSNTEDFSISTKSQIVTDKPSKKSILISDVNEAVSVSGPEKMAITSDEPSKVYDSLYISDSKMIAEKDTQNITNSSVTHIISKENVQATSKTSKSYVSFKPIESQESDKGKPEKTEPIEKSVSSNTKIITTSEVSQNITAVNESSLIPPQKVDPHSPDSVKDATYDISNESSPYETDGSSVNRDSYSSHMSDGEIPNSTVNTSKNTQSELNDRDNHNPEILSDEWIAIGEAQKRAAETLKDISNEIHACESLIKHELPTEYSKVQKVSATNQTSDILNFGKCPPTQIPFSSEQHKHSEPKSYGGTFMLHLISVELSDQAMNHLQTGPYFLTWQFDNQLIAYTPTCIKQYMPMNFASTYNIQYNQTLLNDKINVQLHKGVEEASSPFAYCTIQLNPVFYQPNKLMHFVLPLTPLVPNYPTQVNNEQQTWGTFKCCCQFNYISDLNKNMQIHSIIAQDGNDDPLPKDTNQIPRMRESILNVIKDKLVPSHTSLNGEKEKNKRKSIDHNKQKKEQTIKSPSGNIQVTTTSSKINVKVRHNSDPDDDKKSI